MSVVKAVGNARAPLALLEDFLRCPGIATSQKKLRETDWCKKKAIISFVFVVRGHSADQKQRGSRQRRRIFLSKNKLVI